MQLSTNCECGAILPIKPSQAGTIVPCTACGDAVVVPTLSALRSSLGESYVPTSAIERIRVLMKRGDLPRSGECPYSGRPADCTLLFDVECESRWVRRAESADSPALRFVLFIFLGWIGLFIASSRGRSAEVFGDDIHIEIPLRVNSEVARRILRTKRQRQLRHLLSHTPEYRELFREYPAARVRPSKII